MLIYIIQNVSVIRNALGFWRPFRHWKDIISKINDIFIDTLSITSYSVTIG